MKIFNTTNTDLKQDFFLAICHYTAFGDFCKGLQNIFVNQTTFPTVLPTV